MKLKGLDGKIHIIDLTKSRAKINNNKSSLHLLAREVIYGYFSAQPILEEIYLEGTSGLYADFFIPREMILIEVNGEQHYGLNSFFHKDKFSLIKQQKRDKEKKEWCQINNILYIELPHWESGNEWTERIRRTIKEGM